jgi:hypothetical protein
MPNLQELRALEVVLTAAAAREEAHGDAVLGATLRHAVEHVALEIDDWIETCDALRADLRLILGGEAFTMETRRDTLALLQWLIDRLRAARERL